jgi:hypothetical protein
MAAMGLRNRLTRRDFLEARVIQGDPDLAL